MASTRDSKEAVDDGATEELEHFDDFTLASNWERFISEIEAVCRMWVAVGPMNLLVKDAVECDLSMGLYKVKSELKYNTKNYYMEYYFETNNEGKMGDWIKALHDLQLSFGVNEFLVIAPQSASGVILDAPESSKLLSAAAIALSNCSCQWPAFVPVHDPSRKAYIGIQNMGTLFTRRFEADRFCSQVPIKLMHLEGLYELFVSKFAYAAMDLPLHHYRVHFKMKLTYRTPINDDDDDMTEANVDTAESVENNDVENHRALQWDDDCPWSEWYSAEDPVRGFELLAIWHEITAESSLYMAELENASPLDADEWFLCSSLYPNLGVSGGKTIGFASQLCLLVKAFEMSFEAKFMEDFVSVEKSGSENLKSSAVIPPPTVLDRVLKDIFREVVENQVDFSVPMHKSSRAIKGAQADSLFGQFCLHTLWFGNCNIRAIAVLWIEFVREVRWYWEETQPLPRVPTSGTIDLSTCLVHQKLHMLAICINRKRRLPNGHDVDLNNDSAIAHIKGTHLISGEFSESDGVAEAFNSNSNRYGSAGVAGSMMLLKSCQTMHAPMTQDPPPMTEDMHEERLQAAAALGDLVNFSAQLETDILVSDMSAFKAANPDAVFEDFIRWYSPKDWENDNEVNEASPSNSTEVPNVEWPPHGRLSERMSDAGNSWRKIWNEALPLPASEQKSLLDPNREGEKVLHYLETLKPHQLLGQMVCTAFIASADTLNQTSFGDLKQMATKLGQLYTTMASALKDVQSNTGDPGVFEDLRRLSLAFEHVERLIRLAASLHRKFLLSPHLAEAIFSDYYDYHLPKMGTGSTQYVTNKEFDKKQQVWPQERKMISDMFTPPTAGQSWRKVLSMGNLLNGHEPLSREIIFTKRDMVSGSYYASSAPNLYQQGIETYRMYVCGTSNDLRVALSVASCD